MLFPGSSPGGNAKEITLLRKQIEIPIWLTDLVSERMSLISSNFKRQNAVS
jgi:hypothetical protein